MAASDGDRKLIRTGKSPVVEAALVKWIDNAPLSGLLVAKLSVLLLHINVINIETPVRW